MQEYFLDASREFDEFCINTRLCKLRCWCLKWSTKWVSFILGEVLFFSSTVYTWYMFCFSPLDCMASVGIFT